MLSPLGHGCETFGILTALRDVQPQTGASKEYRADHNSAELTKSVRTIVTSDPRNPPKGRHDRRLGCEWRRVEFCSINGYMFGNMPLIYNDETGGVSGGL